MGRLLRHLPGFHTQDDRGQPAGDHDLVQPPGLHSAGRLPVGNTTIEGKNFVVWDGSNGMNNAMAYVATEPIEVWSFDVMSFVDHTATMEPITDSWYLTSIRAGLEPWSDGVGLGVDSFSAKVN